MCIFEAPYNLQTDNMIKTSNQPLLKAGDILIASPALDDTEFARTVVMIVTCDEGYLGVVMNRHNAQPSTANELLTDLNSSSEIPLFDGGILEKDILFVMHTFSDIEDGVPLTDGMFINGDFDQIFEHVINEDSLEGKARFYLGYAGWEEGQLEQEINEGCWYIGRADQTLLLKSEPENIWSAALQRMGEPYSLISHIPMNALPS